MPTGNDMKNTRLSVPLTSHFNLARLLQNTNYFFEEAMESNLNLALTILLHLQSQYCFCLSHILCADITTIDETHFEFKHNSMVRNWSRYTDIDILSLMLSVMWKYKYSIPHKLSPFIWDISVLMSWDWAWNYPHMFIEKTNLVVSFFVRSESYQL